MGLICIEIIRGKGQPQRLSSQQAQSKQITLEKKVHYLNKQKQQNLFKHVNSIE